MMFGMVECIFEIRVDCSVVSWVMVWGSWCMVRLVVIVNLWIVGLFSVLLRIWCFCFLLCSRGFRVVLWMVSSVFILIGFLIL